MADLTSIPATITAGDSYTLTLTYSDYPASDGWALSFGVAGPDVKAWTSVASGDAHVLTLPALDTAALTAGTYQTRLKAVRSGVVDTLLTGALTVTPDLFAAAPGQYASKWEALKADAEAALSSMLQGGGVQMVTILGRQTMFRSPQDLMKIIAQCEARITAERHRTFGTPMRFDVVGMR